MFEKENIIFKVIRSKVEKTFLLLLFFLPGLVNFLSAQKEDSLKKALTAAADTQKVNIYLLLSDVKNKETKFDEAENLLKQAVSKSESLSNKKFLFNSTLKYSWFYHRRGDFPKSIRFSERAFEIAKAAGDKGEIAEAENLTGMNAGRLGNFNKAIEHYLNALPIFEKNGNKKMQGMVYTNIAGIYFDQLDYEQAVKYFKKVLEIARSQDSKKQIGSSLNNIAAALHNLGKDKEAKEYYLQAVEVNKECHNNGNLGYNYMNLASIEVEEGNMKAAIEYNTMARDLIEKEGDKYSLVQILWQAADFEMEMKHVGRSVEILERCAKLSEETGSPVILERTLKQLAAAYYANGDYKNSAKNYQKYIVTKDSIVNEEVRNAVTKKQMQFEFDKQLLSDSLQQAVEKNFLHQKIEAGEKESALQRKMLFISFGALALVLGLAFVIYRSYQQNKKASKIISHQKVEVEQQKQVLEVKNKEIVDSINYAKSIQDAVLPTEKTLNDLLKNYFILFRPRDIVSGDFYWATEKNGSTFLAVADCTGHGVPGAFMSMLGVSLLNEIVNEKGIDNPAEILDLLRTRVITALKQEDLLNKNKDGMDISLLKINKEKNEITFSSAVNKILFWSAGELKIIRGDKQPIGLSAGKSIKFTNHVFPYKKGDLIYMMTDGFADQFGGTTGKKLKFKPFL
ncbi:MAG: tetratricopeptide repeat protein, partial [Bacteroidia bacterium]|nr:tetratricopeptide repeat protein [Bacteroidia bacterium]